ncbi:MAG: alcohol dehydrogenase catalytic domain-containing protein [Parcubacteria group bacterium]|nr:alcohol dehydrogenase catalytic domain-containing protein [Parcubacteria group bacterium]
MKAVVVQSPGEVVVKDVPDPVVGDYDVLCETLAASVCGATDFHIVHNDPYHNVRYPVILGHEGIGKVIERGKKVKNFKKGDVITRIINRLPRDSGYEMQWGAFAEKSIATDWQAMRDDGLDASLWHASTIHRVLPAGFDPIESTMIITWRETFSFLKRIEPKAGQVVLIIGSGATAFAFADHARNLGLIPVVVGSPGRKELFSKANTKLYISYQDTDYVRAIASELNSGADIIIDAVGKSKTLNHVLPLLKKSGRIGVYGLDEYLDYKIDIAQVQGDFNYYDGRTYDEGSAHDAIIHFIKNKRLNAWDYLDKNHVYPLEKIEDALAAGKTRKVLKSVIRF